MAKQPKETPAPEFLAARQFIADYNILPGDDELDIIALWTLGTWTFSPASPASPATYPYLYVTGAKGSGKTNLAHETLQWIARNQRNIVNVTGAALFRMLGTYDEESGQVINHYPTLMIDEIDAVFASGGTNDEALRGVANAGYKRGSTVPRAAGKTTIDFPVYGPKGFIGIDNGRLPDTITDRSIRIEMVRAAPERLTEIKEGPYSFDVDEEAAELSQLFSDWAKREAMVLRDYRPEKIDGLSPRQWEIARSLVQLARAAGIESRIRDALQRVMTKRPERPDGKVALYQSIWKLFTSMPEEFSDRVSSRQIMDQLVADSVRVPGDSMTGLAALLLADGIQPKVIRLPENHPGRAMSADFRKNSKTTAKTEDQPIQRGYYRHLFDDMFVEFVLTD